MVELDITKDKFLIDHEDFSLIEHVDYPNNGYSNFYDNGDDLVIIDVDICKCDGVVFPYSLITNKQNEYMHMYKRVFRFLGYDNKEVDNYLESKIDISDLVVKRQVSDRSQQGDVSPLEFKFEQNFTNVYGSGSVKYLSREYGICDTSGNNYFIDYLIDKKDLKIGVEENGVTYHHPQIIGKERYKKQLDKQNMCTLWGIKLFRFSSEDCAYKQRIEDDIKEYFGDDTSEFIDNGIKVDRKVELYEHQNLSLEEIRKRRDAGIKAFLVVLPTASGKSKIVEEDIKDFSKNFDDFKALVLVPSVDTCKDWKDRIDNSLFDLKDNIDVYTYSYMAKHYSEYNSNHYNYIVVDEAHHAVAPVLKRVIQYFDADFLIGLTATDQRPDKKKLESVFGSYSTSLSLREAMEKGIVARANVYRIETNIDLSKIRFNGKDYVNADLEKKVRVTSRNELIVDVLKTYFDSEEASRLQGIIFCVNVNHANEMARLLNNSGISSAAYTGQSKKPEEMMQQFKNKQIRFLCACNMISEGWDYPELGILVMARPTLSKVLYLQQIGRGLRKTDVKKNVIVIDVVDEYGAMVKACNMHTIFSNPIYVPFGDITNSNYKPGEMIEINGIRERIERISEVDIDSFEDKYGDYLSQEQIAREYFVSTGTITTWIKKGKLVPSVEYKFGSKSLYLFSPEDVIKYKNELNIKEHNDETIRNDFFGFLEERDYSLSYKMPFLLAFIEHKNSIGEASIDDLLDYYINFYQDRLDRGLQVDRSSCPYNSETLKDRKFIKASMLTNPFEKFERKRFFYYSKDLNVVSINHALFSKLSNDDWDRIKEQLLDDLSNYYKDIGGM